VVSRGNQYVHINYELPRQLSDRQKELLKEFEAEEKKKQQPEQSSASASGGSSSTLSAAIEKAWKRLRNFMEDQKEKANNDK
jgi:DnaJ-class molecular chaperone